MGVNSNANSYIDFGNPSIATANLVQKTIAAWIDVTTLGINFILANSGFWRLYYLPGPYNLYYTQSFNVADGEWYISETAPIGALTFVTLTYDRSSTANDPLFYLNGVNMGTHEKTAPSGVVSSDAGANITALGYPGAGYGLQGVGYDVKLYNRILTPAEILDLYNSRCKITNDNGLVFHAMLDGAAGVSDLDGATLAAGNTLVDRINGAIGVPSGSPVGYADTVLSICGE